MAIGQPGRRTSASGAESLKSPREENAEDDKLTCLALSLEADLWGVKVEHLRKYYQ